MKRFYCANCGRLLKGTKRLNYTRCKCGHKRTLVISSDDRHNYKLR